MKDYDDGAAKRFRHMASRTSMTPGAQRSLDRAAQLAVALGASQIETNHMLWALWLEEGNAAGILNSLGVQREQIELQSPQDLESFVVQTDSMAEEIVYEARQFIRRFDSQCGELTSEHLLLALTTTDAVTLSELGVTEDAIASLIRSDEDTSSLPVSPEFRLEESDPSEEQVPESEADSSALPMGSGPSDSKFRVRSSESQELAAAYRSIDAAANRVREGLRVVEDYVRFVLNDRFLTEELKSCRHKFNSAMQPLDNEQLVRCRDTRNDTGTVVTTQTEYSRESLESVAIANAKRVQEALRTLEEFTKFATGTTSVTATLEQVRYRNYTIEKAIRTTVRSNQMFAGRTLYLLVTELICQKPWQDVVLKALASGVDVIQLREKSLSDEEIVRRGRWLRQQTARAGAMFIMNDRPDLAAATDADGVHIGQDEFLVSDARQILGPAACIGVSTHNLNQAREAVLDGADYLGVGPVFPSKTKSFDEFPGTNYVTQVSEHTSLPWFAIGGINERTVGEAASAGANRIAVSSAICGASDVETSTRSMVAALTQ